MIFGIIKSLITTSIVAALITAVLYIMGFDPFKTFAICLILLFVIGFFAGQINETLSAINNKKLENERINSFAKQGIGIECAYCGESNFVPIRMDIKNEFNCNACNKSNAIYIDIIASRTTNPLQLNPMQVQTVNEDKETAINKLQDEQTKL
jgi:hypothetical protein